MTFAALIAAVLFGASDAPSSSRAAPGAAHAVRWSPRAGARVAALPPSAPVPVVGTNTSVMPPGPAPGETCSATGYCSAVGLNLRCSAFHDNDNDCSTAGTGSFDHCSVRAPNRVCSVLPPLGSGSPSRCSALQPGTHGGSGHQCSAGTDDHGMKCSIKGIGASRCSAFHGGSAGDSRCSVFNNGSTRAARCSTKTNQPVAAKSCSAFDPFSTCSIASGGRGACTAFGAAAPSSCSSFVNPPTHCSVSGGATGSFCQL